MLTKTQTWLVVSIVAATAAFAECKNKNCVIVPERGHEMAEGQVLPAYGAPAVLDVRNSWDFYGTGSFIYWQARQENIEIGLISANDPEGKMTVTGDFPFKTTYVNNMSITSPHFIFRPGFKLGIGARMDWDGWDAYAEYTRFHGRTSSGVRPLPPSTAGVGASHPNGEYLYPIQGATGANGGTLNHSPYFFQSASQTWKLKMDFLDLSLARAYYSGTKLTVRPFFGVRGAWIRQNLKTSYAGSSTYLSPGSTQSRGLFDNKVTNFYTSWGLGPRTGFESNWMIGRGLRFIGNGSGDVLYTRYSLHSSQQAHIIVPFDGNPIFSNASVTQEIDYLRAHLDLEMGLGWGTYFYHNDYHLDLSATYGFQVFWNQNMFRNFVDTDIQSASFAPNGDLFIHGLTMTARFDF